MFARILFMMIIVYPLTAFSGDAEIIDLISLLRIESEFSDHIQRWTHDYDEKAGDKFPEKDPQEVHAIFYQEIVKVEPVVRKTTREILAKAYSDDELHQLTDFYRTASGQKTLTPWMDLNSPLNAGEDDPAVAAFRATPLGQKDARITNCLKHKLWAVGMSALSMAQIHSDSRLNNDASTSGLRVDIDVNFKGENPCPS